MEVCEQTHGRQAAAGQINSCMMEVAVWRALEKEKEVQSVVGSILRFWFEREKKKKPKGKSSSFWTGSTAEAK